MQIDSSHPLWAQEPSPLAGEGRGEGMSNNDTTVLAFTSTLYLWEREKRQELLIHACFRNWVRRWRSARARLIAAARASPSPLATHAFSCARACSNSLRAANKASRLD